MRPSLLLVALGSTFAILAGASACQRCTRQPPPAPAEKTAASVAPAEPGVAPTAEPAPAAPTPRTVRPARLAGSWYDADPAALQTALRGWLGAARSDQRPPRGRLLGVIAPHAGYRFSGRTAASVYRLVKEAAPRRVFILGPSHHTQIRGVAVLDSTHYGTPLGALAVDQRANAALLQHPLFFVQPEAHAREHSVEMQMPFLREVAPRALVVPLVVGALTLPEVHQVAARLRALMGPQDLVVASSDFTHYGPRYGYVPFQGDVQAQLEALDMRARRHIEQGDIAAFWRFKHGTGDTICGFYPISVLMALAGGPGRATLVHYTTSGHDTGDFSNSVSYLGLAFNAGSPPSPTVGGRGPTALPDQARVPASPEITGALPSFLSPEDQRRALQIARRTLTHHFRTGGQRFDPVAAGLVGEGRLGETHGLFVTLKTRKDDELRGCIGSIVGREPLHQGIVRHALNAAFRDDRFRPLQPDELDKVVIEVTVLTPPRPVADANAITIGLDGVILRRDGRSAVFLPQVAVEQGWGLEQTLSALSRKAGLGPDGWRGATFETFQGHVVDERHLGLGRGH